jgi:FkbM family methyltransferase
MSPGDCGCIESQASAMTLPKLELLQTPNGAFFVLPTETIIRQNLLATGSFEPHLMRIAADALRRRGRAGVLVDIGAHIGTFSVPVSLATGCEVVAFEAQRVLAQLLGANFVINGIDRATVKNVILAEPEHPATMSIPRVDYATPGNFGAYSVDGKLFDQMSMPRLASLGGTERVEVRSLDEFALEQVALIKIDVEGKELDVLRGALETLARNQYPPLLFEAWRDEWWAEERRELMQFVKALGYEIDAMDENFFAQHRGSSRNVA